MPWNAANRAKHDVIRERYSSNLSDGEFALIFPVHPVPRSEDACRRACAILNTLFYLIRSGCPWRLLPFPSFATVQNRFYACATADCRPKSRCARDGRARGGGPRCRAADGGRRG